MLQSLGHSEALPSPRGSPPQIAPLTKAGPGCITECGATCESCFSQDFCIQCKRRFYLYKGKCLPTCPPGTAAQQSTRECQGEWGHPRPALSPPSLEQGLVRGVRRPGRNRSRMSRDDGKPNAMSGTHRNPSIH